MKYRVLIAAMLSMGAAVGAEEQAPLVPLPLEWSSMGNGGPLALPGSCEVGFDGQPAADGKQLYSVRCANSARPSFGGMRKTFQTANHRGKRLRISAWVRGEGMEDMSTPQYANVHSEGGLWISLGSASAGPRMDRMQDRTISGTTDWVQRDFVVDVPNDNIQTVVGFWMQGKGQFWMRDLVVEEVPDTVAVNTFTGEGQALQFPDFSLQATTRVDAHAGFLAPPEKWIGIGGVGFELCDFGIDAQMLQNGQRNLSIACSIPSNPALRQSIAAAPWWSKRVRFSGWVKTENLEPLATATGPGGAGLWLSINGNQGMTVHANASVGGEWQYRELVMDVPRNSSWVLMGLALSGTGQTWGRDFKFEEVSMDVPVTPLPGAVQ